MALVGITLVDYRTVAIKPHHNIVEWTIYKLVSKP